MTNPPMTSLGAKIRSHLKEHRPTLVAQLPPHQLDQMSATLQEMTDVAYDQARNSGLSPDQARELARDVWAFRTRRTR